ncbi:hypothetical protein NDU88_001970 [Pleurodeles waltl]|uniref:Secreted protein n=1 Tax=Pleurodeles waltl TaxID=8319 RepID=A0AAV7Q4L6_PLEWA|nr:hypothetical protein NDU88_001970 [Pleurodeles waltl]
MLIRVVLIVNSSLLISVGHAVRWRVPSFRKRSPRSPPTGVTVAFIKANRFPRFTPACASQYNCSRVADFPATFSAGSQSERRPRGPSENEATEVGNLGIRIPGKIPIEGRRAQRTEEGKATGAANPDIWVPERLESEEGLLRCTGRKRKGHRKESRKECGQRRQRGRRENHLPIPWGRRTI